MDPMSLSASIIAVLQLTGTLLSYLNDVRETTKGQAQLAVEASNIYSLLIKLRFRVQQSNGDDEWFTAVRNLGTENGPLDQVKQALERLASIAEPSHGVKKLGKHLMWKFEKDEFEGILRKIERVKSLVNIALTSDLLSLSQAMEKDLSTIREEVVDINNGVQNLHDGQQRTREGVSDISLGVDALTVVQRDEERRKLEDWLSPIDFRSRQQEILRGAQLGTRQWLFDSEKFQNWVNADRGTLWCPGIPGAGKTVTSSIIINHLQSSFKGGDVAVTCLFCNYRDRVAQTAEIFMANLLKQVIQQKTTISPELKDLYDERAKHRPTFADLARLFSHEINHFSKTFVLIDALDETSEHEDIRRLVLSELQTQPINLLVTSRYEKSIEKRLEKAEHLEIRATAADVQTYVKARIPSEHLLARHIKADPALEETIISGIVEKSQGMFLTARFHMDSLVTKTKRKDVRKALKSLPPELDDVYDQTIERIEGQGKDYSDLAKRVLLWVSSTLRPLSPVELQFAVAVQPGMTELDDEDLDEQDLLVSVCAGLVLWDGETDTLRFVHYTTQEYFDRKKESLFGNAHAHIATSCVTYLSFNAFADADSSMSTEHVHSQCEVDGRYRPLMHYAVSNWAEHSREVTDANVSDAVLSFLSQTNNVIKAVRLDIQLRGTLQLRSGFPVKESFLVDGFSALHIAAIYGLKHIVERLIDEGTPADSRDCHGQTPLMVAAMRGHLSLVDMLVERDDVDVNAQTYYQCALPKCARIPQGHGPIPNIGCGVFTALRWAVRKLDITSIERLLEAGADPDTVVENGPILFYALQSIASFGGRFRTESLRFVRLFHEYGANFRAIDNTKRTLLHVAAQCTDFATMEMLLAEGLDPNAIDNIGQSPLYKVLERPRTIDSFELLEYYERRTATVRILLEKGSRLDTVDHRGNTPLHIAAAGVISLDALELLLDNGAKIDSVNNKGCTPFLLAVESSRLDKARLLLKRGASLQDRDNKGATVVHMAVRRLEMLKFLVEESGAEVNVKTNDGSTTLHWALNFARRYTSISGPLGVLPSRNLEVARYLIAHGVDPEAKNINGLTAFEQPNSSKAKAKLRADIHQKLNEELLRGRIT